MIAEPIVAAAVQARELQRRIDLSQSSQLPPGLAAELDPAQLAQLLAGLQPALPPESFRVLLHGVQQELDAPRWAALVRALGLPVIAASVPW